ncbi:MAG: transposase [candidate division WOR-3 bacterium]
MDGYDYSQPGGYFITLCTKNRECLLGSVKDGEVRLNKHGEIVQSEWLRASKGFHGVIVDQFIIMPNHLHAIILISNNVGAIHELPLQVAGVNTQTARRRMLLPMIIGRFKMQSAKYINQTRNTADKPVWQRNYYEHIIRNDDELNKIREYIINNPLQWQFDRENPAGMNNKLPRQWRELEEKIYGKR